MGQLRLGRGFLFAVAACAAVLVWGVVTISGQDDPLVKTEPLPQVIAADAEGEADVRQAAAGPAGARATTWRTARRRA